MLRFNKSKKWLAALTLLSMTTANVISVKTFAAEDDASTQAQIVHVTRNEKVSSGVNFTSEDITDYYGTGNKVVVNRLNIDPTDPNTRIITAKAYDTISAVETIGDQANREILKGNQVVAGV